MVIEDGAHLAYLLIYVTGVTDLGTNLCYYRLRQVGVLRTVFRVVRLLYYRIYLIFRVWGLDRAK